MRREHRRRDARGQLRQAETVQADRRAAPAATVAGEIVGRPSGGAHDQNVPRAARAR